MFYSTEYTKLKGVPHPKTTDTVSDKELYSLHSMHLIFVQLYAVFAFVYSFLISPVVAKELLDAVYQFRKYNLNNSSLAPHISIPNYNVSLELPIVSDFESLIFEEKNLTEDKNMTAAFMNNFFHLSPETPSNSINYDFLINLCQKIAHMIKLPILIFFLIHVDILFEFKF